MGLLPPIVAVLEGNITGFVSSMNQAKGKLDEVDQLSVGVSKRQVQATAAGMMAVGGAFTGVGAVLVGVSDGIERSQATLRQTIENTGGKWDDYKGRVDAAIAAGAHFGKGSSDVQDALAKLTVSYQDPNKALAELQLSEDVAAAKHITLAAAADMVGRAHAGSGKAFKEFGINVKDQATLIAIATAANRAHEQAVLTLDKATQHLADLEAQDAGKKLSIKGQQDLAKAHADVAAAQGHVSDTANASVTAQANAANATKDYDKILNTQLAPRLRGIAEAQAETFGGKLDAARANITNFAGTIGKNLGPALVGIGPVLMGMGGAMQVLTLVTWEGVVATWAFLWPVLAVIAGIALLVGGFIFAYTHFKGFHDAVDAIVGVVLKVVGAIGKFIGDVIGFATHLSEFKDKVMAAIGGAIDWVGKEIPKLPEQIGYALGLVIGKVLLFGEHLVLWAAENIPKFVGKVIQFLLDLPGKIPGFVVAVLAEIAKFGTHLIDWATGKGGGGIPAFVKSVMDELGKLPGQAVEIGTNLVKGIISGITGMAGKAIGAVGDFIKGLVGGANAAGKGQSPYRLFADEVGANIVGGVAMGIQQSGAAMSAMKSHIGALSNVAGSGSYALSGNASDGTGSASGGGVTVQVTVQGNVLNWNDTAAALAGPIREALLRQKRSTGSLGLA